MKVYMVEFGWRHEGGEILGIFATLEAAREAYEACEEGDFQELKSVKLDDLTPDAFEEIDFK